ncbi:MAG: fructose-bisphosphate aldolase class I [Chloroflexota bacterium]|nr:fructose-bisphosphate aldolase class I [Chloroflexota bacterium]
MNELETGAPAILARGKGILAADESTPSIKKRFDAVGVESTPETRRAYRELLFTTPGMEEFIGGVIMFDETIRQAAGDGTPFVRLLADRGIIPGIKVDAGSKPLALAPDETITEGLDGLRERLGEYRGLGARFTKWRAVITIGENIPSDYAIWTNAHALARFAALSQEAGLVPIVEPEVLMDGDHTIEQAAHITSRTILAVFTELHDQRVRLDGILLKPNMILAGYAAAVQPSPDEVADATLSCLRRTVPAAVPGIVFLSGGQSDERATANLNAMNGPGPQAWQISFSYGRALQAAALKAWAGEPANVVDAQRAFYRRAKLNAAASAGRYTPEMESAT